MIRRYNINPFVFILVSVLVITALFFVLGGLYSLLKWASPVLFIATLIINHKVPVNYVKGIINDLKNNTGLGIVKVLLSIFAFPAVIGYLFYKAIVIKKAEAYVEDKKREEEGFFIPYEEVETEAQNLSDDLHEVPRKAEEKPVIVHIPEKETSTYKQMKNEYEDLFK